MSGDYRYYTNYDYAQLDCEKEEYKQSFKSDVDTVFETTKKKIFNILNEEETKEKLIEQMKDLNEDENNKEKCLFLKIPVTKTKNGTTLSHLIDENFRDIDRRCVFDLNYDDDGKTLTLKSDKYIEKKVEELNGHYRSLITTLYLKRVVNLESINDRHIYYLQLPLELQEQARQNNKSLIIRDDVDIEQGYQQSRGFLRLGLFNREEYKENKNNKLLTYFTNSCREQHDNYNLDTMDDLTILKNLWMVKDDGISRKIEFGFNTKHEGDDFTRMNERAEKFLYENEPHGGKRKSRRRLNTKSTRKSRKSKKSRKSRKSRK